VKTPKAGNLGPPNGGITPERCQGRGQIRAVTTSGRHVWLPAGQVPKSVFCNKEGKPL